MADNTKPARPDMREFNKQMVVDFRAAGGIPTEGQPQLVLLTTIGNRSGTPHLTPICTVEDGDDLIVAGSMGGMKTHPQWYRNLRDHPEVTVEYKAGDVYQATATTVLNSLDRDRLFNMMSTVIEGLYSYQDKCREYRQIPVVRLTRI